MIQQGGTSTFISAPIDTAATSRFRPLTTASSEIIRQGTATTAVLSPQEDLLLDYLIDSAIESLTNDLLLKDSKNTNLKTING